MFRESGLTSITLENQTFNNANGIDFTHMFLDCNALTTISLNNLISSTSYSDVKYGIKLCNKNIGFNGKFYTFPYFLTFLHKRFLNEKNN